MGDDRKDFRKPIEKILTPAGLEAFKIQIVDFHNRGVGFMLSKKSIPVFTEPYELRKDKDIIKTSELPKLPISFLLQYEKELRSQKDLISIDAFYYQRIVLEDNTINAVGLIDFFGYFVPIQPIAVSEPDMNYFMEEMGIRRAQILEYSFQARKDDPAHVLKQHESQTTMY